MSENTARSSALSVTELAKAGATVIGVLYGFGFAVVSVHLARYSVSPFGLLRTQYLLAGVWLLVPLVAVALPALWVVAALRHQDDAADDALKDGRQNNQRSWKIWQALWITFTVIILLSVVTNALVPVDLISAGRRLDVRFLLKHTLTTLVFGVVIVALGTAAAYSVRIVRDKHDRMYRIRYYLWSAMFASIAFLFGLMYVGHFAVTAYPRIPASIGGGEPVAIRFILRASDVTTSDDASAGLLVPVSDVFDMLLETADEYIVVMPGDSSRTVVVRKSELRGAILPRTYHPRAAPLFEAQ